MNRAGFTLAEIVIAIAIIATALVAILGLLSAGLTASREAADATVVSTILEDLNHRLKGQPLRAGPLSFSPVFYDASGQLVHFDPTEPGSLAKAIYRGDVEIIEPQVRSAHTESLVFAKVS